MQSLWLCTEIDIPKRVTVIDIFEHILKIELEFSSPRADIRSLHERSSMRIGCEVQACSKHVILSVILPH